MKPQSAKAKGRRFQQYVREQLLAAFPELEADDVKVTSMGAPGEDLHLSPRARKLCAFSIEAKNVERLNIWSAIEQAEKNANGHKPLVVFKRNRSQAYAALSLGALLELLKERNS